MLLGKQDFVEDRVGGLSSWWDRLLEKSTWPLGRPLWREMISDADMAFALGTTTGDGRPGAGLSISSSGRCPASEPAEDPPRRTQCRCDLAVPSSRPVARASGPEDRQLWSSSRRPARTTCSDRTSCLASRTTRVERLRLFVLSDDKEKKDTVKKIYRKSLLYLVSNSYQKTRQQLNQAGIPLLGMATHLPLLSSVLNPLQSRAVVYESGTDPETARDESRWIRQRHRDHEHDAA